MLERGQTDTDETERPTHADGYAGVGNNKVHICIAQKTGLKVLMLNADALLQARK